MEPPFGSYEIWIPVALTLTTFGTFTARVLTPRVNVPGLTLKLPLSRPSTSTFSWNVPRMPVRLAVTPLLDWALPPLEPPKPRLAWLTPMPIVRTSFPPLKPMSSSPKLGPCSVSGPSETDAEDVNIGGSCTVMSCCSPAVLGVPSCVANAPAPNATVTLPAWNRPSAPLEFASWK